MNFIIAFGALILGALLFLLVAPTLSAKHKKILHDYIDDFGGK